MDKQRLKLYNEIKESMSPFTIQNYKNWTATQREIQTYTEKQAFLHMLKYTNMDLKYIKKKVIEENIIYI